MGQYEFDGERLEEELMNECGASHIFSCSFDLPLLLSISACRFLFLFFRDLFFFFSYTVNHYSFPIRFRFLTCFNCVVKVLNGVWELSDRYTNDFVHITKRSIDFFYSFF